MNNLQFIDPNLLKSNTTPIKEFIKKQKELLYCNCKECETPCRAIITEEDEREDNQFNQ